MGKNLEMFHGHQPQSKYFHGEKTLKGIEHLNFILIEKEIEIARFNLNVHDDKRVVSFSLSLGKNDWMTIYSERPFFGTWKDAKVIKVEGCP